MAIQKRFYPNATLVAHHTQSLYKDVTIERYGQVHCLVTLFLTPYYLRSHSLLIPPPSHTTWDCYWYGSFEYLRQKPLPTHWGGHEDSHLNSTMPNLFVFVDRDRRTPHITDRYAFRLYLRDIADEAGLEFHDLAINSTAAEKAIIFSRAKVVVAVHGGALANMIFMNSDTIIIEIHPIAGERRYCFLYGLWSGDLSLRRLF